MEVEILKCFVASPSDTTEERGICDDVLGEINATLGDIYKFRIESVKWENQAYPDFAKDGQDVLNNQLRPGDHPFFIGILKYRFGTPTPRANSGTEEEFDQAYANWEADKTKNIQFYFEDQPPQSMAEIDHDQLSKVRSFRKKLIEKGGLYCEYKGGNDFKKLLTRNLTRSLSAKYQNLSSASSNKQENGERAQNLKNLQNQLKYALQSYKGQPEVFVEPCVSDSREIDDEKSLLGEVIASPYDAFVIAPPQFGLTCLSLHMRIEAYKNHQFWVHLDASHVKARHALRSVEEQILQYNEKASDVKCILVDEWNSKNPDHIKIVNQLDQNYPGVPLILFTNDGGIIDPSAALSLKKRTFRHLHLQALSRNKIRQLLKDCCPGANDDAHEKILGQVTSNLDSINIHRTPLNCLILHRVSGSEFNEKLLNKSKLMKAILFVLFTDSESFSYADSRPDADECAFVLGKFCKTLIQESSLSFDSLDFKQQLKDTCKQELISLDVESMVNVLIENNILLEIGSQFEFKHRFWVFYFAAEWMMHDAEFRAYILEDQRYTNFPELIDFYTGIDGKRSDAMEVIVKDLEDLTHKVDAKIGIAGEFNPLADFLWNPTARYIEKTRKEIAEKVDSSNLPAAIKDKHADASYNSDAPYNQSINNFLHDYSVYSLRGSIAAASRALRNSTFVSPELKLRTAKSIIMAWEEISKVAFWISPILAKEGRAAHDGLALVLADSFSKDLEKRFEQILIANPTNIVSMLKDDLSSKKIGVILYQVLDQTKSDLRKHLLAIFLIEVRPDGWYDVILNHLNRLHPSSFYLSSLLGTIKSEIQLGYIDHNTEVKLKNLTKSVLAKRRYASKAKLSMDKKIDPASMFSDEHMLPIDQLLAKNDPTSPENYGRFLKNRK